MDETTTRTKFTLVVEEAPPTLGVFEWFELQELVTEDSKTRVYQAKDSTTGNIVHIRRLQPYFLGRLDTKRRAMLTSELIHAAELTHANITHTSSVETAASGEPYLVEAATTGIVLDELAKRKPPSIETVRNIALQLCDALEYAHANKVVHGCLTPLDVTVTYPDDPLKPVVRIANFGIREILKFGAMMSDLTGHGILLDPHLIKAMSPEQALGKAVDERTDIYGLGRLVYRLLFGRLWSGDAPIPSDQTMHDIELLKIPVGLDAVLKKMTAENPENRYQSIEKVRNALLMPALLQGETIPLHMDDRRSALERAMAAIKIVRPGPTKSNETPDQPQTGAPSETPTAAVKSKKSPVLVALAAGFVLGGVFFFFSHKDAPVPRPVPVAHKEPGIPYTIGDYQNFLAEPNDVPKTDQVDPPVATDQKQPR